MSIRNSKMVVAIAAVAMLGAAVGFSFATHASTNATDCNTYTSGPRLNPFPVDYAGAPCTDYPLVSGKADGGSYPMSNAQLEAGTMLHAGQEGTVRIYVHNGSLDTGTNGITTAKNVYVHVRTETGTGAGHGVFVDAHADNASSIGGGYIFHTDANETLEIIPNSVTIYGGNGNVLSSGGAISNNKDITLGNMQGCYEFLRVITFKVRVKGPTITPTPPNATLDAYCPLGAETQNGYESRTLIKFRNGINDPSNAWMSSKTNAGRRTQETVNAALVAGTYRVILASFDDHTDHPNQHQTRERYYLELKDNNGNVITRTGTSMDIPENQRYQKSTVNTALVLGDGIAKTTPAHGAYPDNSAHNSVTAVCAAFDKVRSHTDLNPSLSMSKRVRNLTQNSGETTSVTAHPGETVEFIIRVTNSGNADATHTMVSDTLPSRLNFISGSVTVDGNSASDALVSGGIDIGTVAANGQTRTIKFRAQVANDSQFDIGTTTLINTASARADGTATLTDQASVVVTKNPQTLVCSPAHQTVNMNQTVSFNANGGRPSNNGYMWSAPGGNPTTQADSFSFSTQYAQSGTYDVTVRDLDNRTSTCMVTVNANQNPSLSITKRVSNITRGYGEADSVSAQPNDTIEVILRVTNTGNARATGVIVWDALPSRLINQSDFVITGNGINIGTLEAGQTRTVSFRVSVAGDSQFPNGTTTLTNYGYARADQVGQVSDSADVMVTKQSTSQPHYGLTIRKTGRDISKGEINEQDSLKTAPGDTLDFFIRVRNTSSVTITNVIVRDVLPGGLQYINNTSSLNGNQVADGVVSGGINIGSLTPNQEAVIRFNAVVRNAAYFAKGVSLMSNAALTKADTINEIYDELPIAVHNGSVLGGVIDIKTGAGSTTALSVALTMALGLGYMAYTQTGFFRKRQAWSIISKTKANKDKFNFVV